MRRIFNSEIYNLVENNLETVSIVYGYILNENCDAKMEYYRPNINSGITPSNSADTSTNLLNSASDSYASNYWNVSYSDGISPMKQIEGNLLKKKLTQKQLKVRNGIRKV